MKINGQIIDTPNSETIVIPRGNSEDIVFQAAAVLSYDAFDNTCKPPEPREKMIKGGKKVADYDDVGYQQELSDYAKKRTDWIVIQSLKATPGLEWETVKDNEPETWKNYQNELIESKFSTVEINRIISAVFAANCLSEARLEEARQRFLRGTV